MHVWCAVLLVAMLVGLSSGAIMIQGPTCDIAGSWLVPDNRGYDGRIFDAVDTGDGTFNISLAWRHGPGVTPGKYTAGNNITIEMKAPWGPVTGHFSEDCNSISISAADARAAAPPFGSLCRGWTNNCTAAAPPFGQVFSIWSVFQSNMVLQQEPQKAAVYGIAPPLLRDPQVSVTVTDETTGEAYTVKADVNATQQPYGPGFEYPWPYPGVDGGPFTTWKVLLNPTAAGGNYTIEAKCFNCDAYDPMYRNSSIMNVTFGDMWYCSGQSNMWLPVSHSFARNETFDAILNNKKYRNIFLQAGNSGSQGYATWNPWMNALDAAVFGALDNFGAACWYFAMKLTDEMEAAGRVVPIGLQDTAVGGQRIEEYMDNTTIGKCSQRAGENLPQWDGPLFGKFVMPYVDMTVKGWTWYQGENNMHNTKGNVLANVGYGCEMADLVAGWRARWSRITGTTDPMAPFGIVTLASSGSEGGPDMGAMRWAQTANYGILPNPAIPNSFLAQAYDLDDPWGPNAGPCATTWACCNGGWRAAPYNETACMEGTKGVGPSLCAKACEAELTPVAMGGIHPRDKKPLGDRLGTAAWNSVYGGSGPTTGPTLSGCTLNGESLTVTFNETLLRGDSVVVQPYNMSLNMSYLEVQTDPSIFCVEVQQVNLTCRSNSTYHCPLHCPTWAGGSSATNNSALSGSSDQGWQPLNISVGTANTVTVDLSPLRGVAPTAVRYAWGTSECCDKTDPMMYITKPCGPAACPIMGKSGLFPANPFIAKIVGGKCECVAPQTCEM